MKKIPTLFEREFENHSVVRTLDRVTPGMEWVLEGDGVATVKWDGSCCALINGVLYKRYDAKRGKKAPANAISCCDPDPVTGHWPHWVPVDESNPADKWFVVAFNNTPLDDGSERTYEAVGPHFQGNPHHFQEDRLIPHGVHDAIDLSFPRSYEGMRDYLATHQIEGVVFWKDGEPRCKIKRSDFGFEWPPKEDA